VMIRSLVGASAAWATSAGAGSGSATGAASVPASARAGVVSEARAMPANARSARRARSSIAWQFRHESRWRSSFSRSSVLSSSLARAPAVAAWPHIRAEPHDGMRDATARCVAGRDRARAAQKLSIAHAERGVEHLGGGRCAIR
jgi:hypothetical protein